MFPINSRIIKIEFQISFFTITGNIQVFLLKLLLVFTSIDLFILINIS